MTTSASHQSIPARGEYTEAARQRRLDWLRQTSGADLESLDQLGIDATTVQNNVENLVGTVEVPVGLAGPLLFAGDHARGLVTTPLATTEGALVASVTRGANAVTRSGGVVTRVIRQRMVRAPGFEFGSIDEAARFAAWVPDQHAALAEQVRQVSKHSVLVEVDPVQLGRVVHVRFCYETGDAAGQNMTTAATHRGCEWIVEQIEAASDLTLVWHAIEAVLNSDKKQSALNRLGGRGHHVVAECALDRATLHDVLKTTAGEMERILRIATVGGQYAGLNGVDINAANVIAAIFIATGQDAASVYESGAAIFSGERVGDGLRMTLLLPNLVVGTVGGGTGLQKQHDYLESLGCAGTGGARRLAEIIAGFALALNISTMAAVTAGQFVDAHERLGRNHPE
ncbi:hydroxymethylglutaryl-CoA reductase [Nocardia blacklockiae]|uniref:hydroxymethylglutaryl-CoA reductase n=1 Tax=Nocardia blacklockiae TaxID=480036 RepID=UPI00189345EA|nr:hydroxymethylglutaryl-CoA reductase [Nocardia blacklockiae]MBF6176580.1 hydroxymethylglutaryl-CoA reductase [Nocardia blacklockiae]